MARHTPTGTHTAPDASAGDETPHAGSHALDVIAVVAIAASEAVVAALLLLRAEPSGVELGLLHIATLAALGAVAYFACRRRRDATVVLLALIAAVPLGPLGAVGALVVGLLPGQNGRPSPLIQDWYDRIALSTAVAPETRLCEDVGVGRTLDLSAPAPEAFARVMTGGELAERQTLLGLIARRFHVSQLEPLQLALQSPEPTIRVQAAAVAAHITPAVRRRLLDCSEQAAAPAADPLAALGLLGEIMALMGSGLVDESDLVRAREAARRLGDRVLEAEARRPLSLPYTADPARAAELEASLDQLLIERRRFGALRAARRARRVLATRPRARFKRLDTGRQRAEAQP